MAGINKFFRSNSSEDRFEVFSNGSKSGPFSRQEIISFAREQILREDAMIKISGVWTLARDVDWLLPEYFNSTADDSAESVSTGWDGMEQISTDDKTVTCPHCWHRFNLSQINFIAKHLELVGDPVIGPEAQLRFLPTAFNEQGYAIDSKGMVCQDMACPNCHQKIPEAVIDLPGTMFSIVGAPASGKSYYLAAMTWQLRNVLATQLDYSLIDTDTTFNSVLNNYESILFLNRNNEEYVALPKTELQGSDFSHQIMLNGLSVDLPLPFIFTLKPTPANQCYTTEAEAMRNIILYDNAGEHFEPGRDTISNLSTLHLVHSSGIMFLYDPIKDSRMVSRCNPKDPQVSRISRGTNQLILLNEMIARIKKYTGMKMDEKYSKPLVIIIPKYDAWREYFPYDLEKVPYLYYNEENFTYSLEIAQITNISFVTRDMLLETAPEVVTTCESFFEQVYFLPASALGRIPEYDTQKDMIAIKPDSLNPIWAAVPMLLQLWLSGNIPAVVCEFEGSVPVEKYKFNGSSMIYTVPGTHIRANVPPNYWGKTVYCKEIQKYIKFPKAEESVKSSADDDFWAQ